MTKQRPGFHDLFAQVPAVLWDRLVADADERGVSITRTLIEVLRAAYNVPADQIPKPKRAGRKPKRRK